MKKAVVLALILVMTLLVFAGCDNTKTSVKDNNDTNVTDTENILEDSDIIPEEHTDETVEKDTERERG